jgi:hypothetical protein
MSIDPVNGGMPESRIFLYLIFHDFAKIYGLAHNLAKIYIWRRGLRCQGHNAVGHGARCRQEWAPSRNAKGHGVNSMLPCPAALGA